MSSMGFFADQLPAQPIVYMSRIGEYDHFDKLDNSRLESSFMQWVYENELYDDCTIYEIKWDKLKNTLPQECRYDICLVAGADCPIDDGMHRGEISSGNYAAFCMKNFCSKAEFQFWKTFKLSFDRSKWRYDETKPILKRRMQKMDVIGLCDFCVPILPRGEWWE